MTCYRHDSTFVTCDKIAIIVFSWYTTIFSIGYLWTCSWQCQFVRKNLSLNFKESYFYLGFADGSTSWYFHETTCRIWCTQCTVLSKLLSNTHYAGLATANCLPKCRVLICWAQYSAAQVILFGSCLEIVELEHAQPISYTDIFY